MKAVALSILLLGDSFTAMPYERPLPQVMREMGLDVTSPGKPGDGPHHRLAH